MVVMTGIIQNALIVQKLRSGKREQIHSNVGDVILRSCFDNNCAEQTDGVCSALEFMNVEKKDNEHDQEHDVDHQNVAD